MKHLHGYIACVVEVDVAVHYDRAVYLDASFAQCLKVAVLAPLHHVQVLRPSYEGYAPAASVYQVQRGFFGRLVAVGCHRREHLRQACPREEYERYAHVVYLYEVGIVYRVLRQAGYYADNVHADEVVNGFFLALVVFVAVGCHYGVSRLGGIVFDSVKNGSVVMCHKVWHHHAYHVGGVPSQALGERIGAVVHFLRQCFHFGPQFFAYFMAVP